MSKTNSSELSEAWVQSKLLIHQRLDPSRAGGSVRCRILRLQFDHDRFKGGSEGSYLYYHGHNSDFVATGDVKTIPVARRMSPLSKKQTTWKEDRVYSLLCFFILPRHSSKVRVKRPYRTSGARSWRQQTIRGFPRGNLAVY